MSETNSTPTITLPLFIATDKPAWLVDWNGAMNAIDSAIAALQTAESGTATALSALSNSVTALSNTVSQQTTAIETVTQSVNQLAGNVNTINGNINTINSLIGNGEPTTTDKTLIGAINEINAKIPEGGEVAADDVTYDNTSSGLMANNVQAAIDEVHDCANIAYDNTDSGLVATDVQSAIDELASSGVGDPSLIATATGSTWGDQLTSLQTAYASLTAGQKLKAFLLVGANIYHASNNAGGFSYTSYSGGQQHIIEVNISNATATLDGTSIATSTNTGAVLYVG